MLGRPWIVLCAILSTGICQENSDCVLPVKEGTSGVISCFTKRADATLEWLLLRDGINKTLSICRVGGSCQDFFPSQFTSNLTLNSSTAEIVYNNELTILRGNRNETNFVCLVNGMLAGNCHLEIFVPPSQPTCDTPVLDSSMKKVNITCRTLRVYPDATMYVYYNDSDVTLSENRTWTINCSKYPSPISAGDYKVECVVLITLAGATPGNLRMQGSMRPVLTDNNVAIQAAVNSTITSPLVLTAPTAKISNCPVWSNVKDGNITSGSNVSYLCELNTVGSPPGQAMWYITGGKPVGTVNKADYSSTLTLTYNQTDPTTKGYYCVALTSLATNLSSVTFTAQFALPPASAPVIWLKNSQVGASSIVLTEGEDAEMLCRVDGGVPEVSNVTLTCGAYSNVTQGKIVTLNIKASKFLNGLSCICVASHVTGCYNKTAHVNIKGPRNGGGDSSRNTGLIIGALIFLVLLDGRVGTVCFCKGRQRARSSVSSRPKTKSVKNNNADITTNNSHALSLQRGTCQSSNDTISISTDYKNDVLSNYLTVHGK